MKNKCKSIDRNSQPCRCNSLPGSVFCKFHDYMKDYTDEMIKNVKLCLGCNKLIYLKPGEICPFCEKGRLQRKTKQIKCEATECNSKAKPNGYCGKHQIVLLKHQIEKEGYKMCAGRSCQEKLSLNDHSKCRKCLDKDNEREKNRRDRIKEENNSLLQTAMKITQQNTETNSEQNNNIEPQQITMAITQENTEINSEQINNIEPQQSSETKSNLSQNIIKPKITLKKGLYLVDPSNVKLKKAIDERFSLIDLSSLDPVIIERKQYFYNLVDSGLMQLKCPGCGHMRDIDEYIGINGLKVSACRSVCREKNKKNDAQRAGRKRNYKKYDDTPEVKARKKKWCEQRKYKVQIYNIRYMHLKTGEDYFERLKKSAERMKKYRLEHPEKVIEINESRRLNPHHKLVIYKYSAQERKIAWNLPDQVCLDLFMESCIYCGIETNLDTTNGDAKNLNGIDRLDNDIGYTIENCVTCCSMCNYMKCCMYPSVFIDMCEHILTYNGEIQGNLFPNIFLNYTSCKLSIYKQRAMKKNLQFELTEQDFDNIVGNDCYLCGKKTDGILHINGIDRFNNEIGYTQDNCRPCCANCNYMKSDYSYDDFIEKLMDIYFNNEIKKRNSGQIIEIDSQVVPLIATTDAKKKKKIPMTDEEKRKKNRLRQQKCREAKKNNSTKI